MASWQTAESAGESFRGLLLCHCGRTGLIQRQLVGQVLVQVVAEIPPHAEPVGGPRTSSRSERRPSKDITSRSLKKTIGSIGGRPAAA